jgi:hypothetical protein
LKIGIAQQRKIQPVLVPEGGQRFDGIAAGAENRYIELVEMLLCVTKLGRFDRSTRGVGLGEEKEEHALAAKIGKRDVLVVVGFQPEVGSFVA